MQINKLKNYSKYILLRINLHNISSCYVRLYWSSLRHINTYLFTPILTESFQESEKDLKEWTLIVVCVFSFEIRILDISTTQIQCNYTYLDSETTWESLVCLSTEKGQLRRVWYGITTLKAKLRFIVPELRRVL